MKLIHIKDYLLLIDEEAKICQMDLYLDVDCNTVTRATLTSDQYNGCKKIIAYYPLTDEAKELDLPLLPNPFEEEVDIDKIANEWFLINNYNKEDLIHSHSIPNCITTKNLFIEGYKAAQSHSKRFSLEDIKKAIEMAREADSIDGTVDLHIILNYPNADNSDLRIKWIEEEIIQSLVTQKLPKEFVGWLSKKKCPYDFTSKCTIDSCDCEFVFETITNSEGKQVLVGTYKY